MPRWVKVVGIVIIVLATVLLGVGLYVRSMIRGSLAQLDGEVALPGLAEPVAVERDDLGVPTVRGATRQDVARGLGFVHAQDRFFQMDLLRRQGAGELSELFGPATLEVDRAHRTHRFRSRAQRAVERLPADHRAVLDAYVTGVNDGLDALGKPPFEYLLLGIEPGPWRAEDSILVLYAMYFELNDSTGRRESARGVAADTLDPALYAFLTPVGTSWDAPIHGGLFDAPPLPAEAPADPPPITPDIVGEEPEIAAVGSNNWAVAGSRTADGRAILADDMHLGLGIPNTWYRARLLWNDREGGKEITGVTLPGAPTIVAGSNTRVAWGFTNAYGDWTDLVILEPVGDGYQTPDGPRDFDVVHETILVRDAEPDTLDIRTTVWGPVIDQDHAGRPRALRWTAHDPEGADMGLLDLESATSLEEALTTANTIGIPPQNFVCADDTGRIGWTIIGRIPRRTGFGGDIPTSWADGARTWDGFLTPDETPSIVDPADGMLWTANNRTTSNEFLAVLGDGGFANGARARQIRNRLRELDAATEVDMLAIQLDDRAVFLSRWRDLALGLLTDEAVADHPRRQQFRKLVETTWTGHASTGSQAFRLVRTFRLDTFELVYGRLMAPCVEADEDFDIYRFAQWEDAVWRLVTEQPAHLLGTEHESWNEVLLAAVDATMAYIHDEIGTDPELWTWGRRNSVMIQHPISRAVPQLAGWLDMPTVQLPGASIMPRVQSARFGASERFAVSPGREDEGYFHMPGGQSGHPLSPFYRAGHDAWVDGEPTPFLPGPTVHTLTLLPAGG
ncbi:MAG: penicillin acylase family protein [Thermoanaerobaculales bacterium]|jgi:penicillin amidase|nr:penicillin acylase family protein [Thermoanaerobaculales bacterium]